jgi:hypothetical protein
MASLSLQEPIPALIDRTRSERPPDNSRSRREPIRHYSKSASRSAARRELEQAPDFADFFAVNGASRSFVTSQAQSLAKRLQVEGLGVKHAIRAIRTATILIAAVVSVVIAATEALAKVVVVVVLVYIIATIAVVRVLIGI